MNKRAIAIIKVLDLAGMPSDIIQEIYPQCAHPCLDEILEYAGFWQEFDDDEDYEIWTDEKILYYNYKYYHFDNPNEMDYEYDEKPFSYFGIAN